MTIKHVNILTIDGKSLLFREYGATKVDQDLLAGFLSAFSGFMMEISQAEIKSTITGNSKFIYSIAHDIIVVICTDIYDQEEEISPKIESIMEGFWSRYHNLFENNDWDGERTVFKEFKQEIDRIILGPIKVSILGYAGVGKTTLTRLIVGEEVNLEYVPTITADIANFDKLGPRKIVLWDFAGQIQFTDLWDSLLRGTRIVLLVTDSTYTNVQETKVILERFLTKRYKEAIIIGIANKQDLPNRLTPQFIEKILNIPTYAMISINPDHRIIILEILKKIIGTINKQDGLLEK
ncbi:GTP-binding protein [Candidatus Harpocratesius sp.]